MRKSVTPIIALLALIGIAIAAYPVVSNYLSEKNGSFAIQVLDEEVAKADDETLAAERKKAEKYNSSLTGSGITDPFLPGSGLVLPDNYMEILDFANHAMGYIEIPKIKVNLPIYHGVSEQVLAEGVGHLGETAFPIGGEGNHCVLTGHTGLVTAKLFTELTELTEGDVFFIHILNETLAYEVDQIKVIEPDETNDLLPVPGQDYITLLTCTPYGVNTHRLLVRGERTEYIGEVHETALLPAQNTARDSRQLSDAILTAWIMGNICLIVLIVTKLKDKSTKNGHGAKESKG